MAVELPPVAPTALLPPVPKPPSGVGFTVAAGLIGLGSGLLMALFRPSRQIGTVVAGVTIEETGHDDLEITRHPVEVGAPITDHAYKQPCEVTIRCGWTASGHLPGYVSSVYASLLSLQANRQLFTVTTGKRKYPNMLLASLGVTTAADSENALMVTAICREVILVQSKTVTVAPRAQQAAPQSTDATQSTGAQQATPAPKVSLLRQGTDAAGATTPGAGAAGATPGPQYGPPAPGVGTPATAAPAAPAPSAVQFGPPAPPTPALTKPSYDPFRA